ncbi:MAG: undecaprenyl-diphosphate phosphatase [Candidatus Omnitrophota bacterium]|jgi:undecaprenyl-diphosphatase
MIKYIILGIVQGLTEFFPVSSSGHLVIVQKLLGITQEVVSFDVVLHLGTTVALIIFFFKDIVALFKDLRLLGLVFVATIITGVIGIAGKDFFERLFALPQYTAFGLLVTGCILLVAQRFMNGKRNTVTLKDSIVMGCMQGIAVIPGISRSGSTVSALLFRGLDRETSFRFSFIAAIPAVLGAAVLKAKDIGSALQGEMLGYALGFITSAATGIVSLWLLRLMLRRAKLHYFGYYCFVVAILVIVFIK